MLKIMIVDNNILFREGLCNLLEHEPGISVVGHADSIAEALHKLDQLEPNLTLVDADLPDMDDFNGLRLLRRCQPLAQLVLLTSRESGDLRSGDLLVCALRNGARGYLPKHNSITKFMASIRAIERGEAVIPRALVGRLVDEFTRIAAPVDQEGLGLLTPRELDVLCELGRGHSNRQIANELNIAENTVKVHVHNILEKLNLHNRRQASRFARSQGSTDQPLQKSFGPA